MSEFTSRDTKVRGKGALMRSSNDFADMGRWRQIIINGDTTPMNFQICSCPTALTLIQLTTKKLG